jgi:hypothetical protein
MVTVRTLSPLGNYSFNQQGMQYTVDISKPNFVTIILPQAMLGGKYVAHINYNHLLTTVYHQNQTHSWIGVRPSTNGTIQVIGSTVIPEFPLFVPLLIGMVIMIVLPFRSRLYHY